MARTRELVRASVVMATTAAFASTAGAREYWPGHHDDEHSDREGIIVQVGMVYGAVRADEAKLHTLQSEPGPLEGRDLRLDGGTSMMGGMLGAVYASKDFRVGLFESFSGAQGLKLLHAPLDDRSSVDATAWRLAIEIVVGHQFAVGKLSPYADLRVGCSMLNATVKLVDADRGVLGTTNYTAWAPVIGPRVGVIVPVAKHVIVDVGLTYGLIGHDSVGLTLGLGYAPFGSLAP